MRRTALTTTCLAMISASVFANWPSFRGPFQNGATTETNIVEKFSKTENLKWRAAMPGPAASVPAVWENHVFVTSSDPENRKLWAIALDATSGAELWKFEVSEGYQHDERSNLASPSPCTDGKLVYFFYGDSELVALDFSGKLVWRKNLGKQYGNFATQWTYSSSPVLDLGRLYIQVLQRNEAFEFHGTQKGDPNGKNESYILALNPADGSEIWRVVRPSDAVAESLESFSSPVFHDHEGKRLMLISGGDTLTGHEADTGKELFRLASWNHEKIGHWRLVPSPVAGDGVVLACAPKKNPVFAIDLNSRGTVEALWTSDDREVSSDVSTPLFYEGKFYVLDSDRKALACVEPKTGKIIWRGEFPTRIKLEGSPTGADGKIYVIDQLGTVFVAKAGGDKFELLHQASFGKDGATSTNSDNIVRGSVVVANGKILVRAQDAIYCLGK